MNKATKEQVQDNETREIQEKLEYIGLNLEKIPTILTQTAEIKYKATNIYKDTSHKVYKYINPKEIEILITPSDRLDNLNEKFRKADYLANYIKPGETPEELEKNAIFLKLLKELNLNKLKKVEEQQKLFQEKIPYEVKYRENFTWQIFYSETSQNYFMLFPSNETEVESLFYIILKKLENNKKKEYIYVPIIVQDYSNTYLKKSEIEELENSLWLFTNHWPSFYEVYDKEGKNSIQIIGETAVYDKINSKYKIVFENKDQAQKEFSKIRALFILQSKKPAEYTFKTMINEEGSLDLCLGYKVITYDNIVDFIKQEYLMKRVEYENIIGEILLEKENLELLNQTVKKQNEEYLMKEKQIVIFLECKKTFFGKVKYFFQSSKKVKKTKEEKITQLLEEKKLIPTPKIEEERKFPEKKQYTIEDVLEIGEALQNKEIEYKNIQMDKKALENKKENLERKIKNATMYINEIESHKKSIFDFWKYTNKDEVNLLMQNEKQDEDKSKEKLKKTFKYEEDIEEFSQKIDTKQRETLLEVECDAMFAIYQDLETFKLLEKDKVIKRDINEVTNKLNKWKEQYEENMQANDFFIFGAKSDTNDKIKTLNNAKHRENDKNIYEVLQISEEVTIEQYIETIKNYRTLLKQAYDKISTPVELPVYIANEQAEPIKGLEILSLNPETAINAFESNVEEFNLHKYNMQEGMNMLFFSNIIFHQNENKTLPLGMDVTKSVLIDFSHFEAKLIARKNFKLNIVKNEFENQIKTIHVYEYNVEKK